MIFSLPAEMYVIMNYITKINKEGFFNQKEPIFNV